jgi:hypothetical protein
MMRRATNERYTPAEYIEAARRVLGTIDLDPASCEFANRTVKATRYFTEDEDGLAQAWKGRIWLNPPYGRTTPGTGSTKTFQKLFVAKLLQEYQAGHIEAAIMLLLGNVCFVRYFYPLWQYTLCIHDGGIAFYDQNGVVDQFGFGSIFVYLGPYQERFIEEFRQFGICLPAGVAIMRNSGLKI